jgi:hypothetical protein
MPWNLGRPDVRANQQARDAVQVCIPHAVHVARSPMMLAEMIDDEQAGRQQYVLSDVLNSMLLNAKLWSKVGLRYILTATSRWR